MEIPQGDINTNLITSTITSILTHTQHHKPLSLMSPHAPLASTRTLMPPLRLPNPPPCPSLSHSAPAPFNIHDHIFSASRHGISPRRIAPRHLSSRPRGRHDTHACAPRHLTCRLARFSSCIVITYRVAHGLQQICNELHFHTRARERPPEPLERGPPITARLPMATYMSFHRSAYCFKNSNSSFVPCSFQVFITAPKSVQLVGPASRSLHPTSSWRWSVL